MKTFESGLKVVDSAKAGSTEPLTSMPANQIPILRRFYGNKSEWRMNDDFYSATEEVERARKRVKLYPNLADDLAPMLALYPMVTSRAKGREGVKEKLRQLRELKDQAKTDKEKRKYQTQIEQTMGRFLKRYYAAKQRL